MAYVKDTDILDATDGGLEIILAYYPAAADTLHRANKHFKLRESEKTASASLKKLPSGVWVVTDFGGDRLSRNGIMVCMQEDNLDYNEACQILGARYHVAGAEIKIYKPTIAKRPLNENETVGEYDFDYNESFIQEELALLGPRVNEDHCREYRLFSCKSYIFRKGNEAVTITATPEFPIFVYEFGTWQKIYSPKAEKQYRFGYAGNKPKKHTFGLDVIKKEFDKNKKKLEEEDEDWDEEDDKKGKKKKDARLDAVFIVSGGSDAINLRSFNKYPIWFNSETEHLEWEDYKNLKVWVKEIYYIGDLDTTGVKQAIALGLKFMDIKLLWLPEKIKQFRDQRGNPRKDFKDYVSIFYKEKEGNVFTNAFNRLIENALPMQFWTETYTKEGKRYNLSNTRLYHFLQHLGFGRYENKNSKDGYMYIRKEGNIVRILDPNEIENFVHEFLEQRGMSPDLRDYFYKSPQLGERSMAKLPKMKIDFTSADRLTQYFFFPKEVWKIQESGITRIKQGDVDKFVWEDKIIDFNIKKDEPHFKIAMDGSGDLDIEILKKDNMFLNYLINTSRVHWKEELEDFYEGRPPLEGERYYSENKFNIAGPNLSDDQKLEHKLHLINKIFSIGYMLHGYKNYNKPWAVFAMDNKVSDLGESHGGSGKSLCYGFLNKVIKRRVYLKGRDPKLTQNDFIYHEVTRDTDYILVDDATQYLNFDYFFSEITGSLKVNPKNGSPFEIPFEESPKFVFTSNFSIRNMDPSTARRILFTVFSDYYHSSDDEYKQIRKVSDDFGGRNLFTDFKDEDYNDFYNFCAQCVQFFLSYDVKVNPPMDNVTKRNLQTEMGDAFMGWAEAFFDSQNERNVYRYRNQFFSKEAAFDDCIKTTKLTKWTPSKFKKALKAFCSWNGWVFNPKEFLNSSNRIIQKINGKSEEMIFIDTTAKEAVENSLTVRIDEEEVLTVFDQE